MGKAVHIADRIGDYIIPKALTKYVAAGDAKVTPTDTFWLHRDHLGSVRALAKGAAEKGTLPFYSATRG